jgi:hypothetical protein
MTLEEVGRRGRGRGTIDRAEDRDTWWTDLSGLIKCGKFLD